MSRLPDHTIFSALHFPYGRSVKIHDLRSVVEYYLRDRNTSIEDFQLRRYMPNVFATTQGDTPLYDKVLPWLETAERWLFSMSWDFSLTASCHTQIIERLRSVIASALQGNTLNIQSLRDTVDFMRKHDEQFPEFRSSRTYKLFAPPIFENKKNYHGYFL